MRTAGAGAKRYAFDDADLRRFAGQFAQRADIVDGPQRAAVGGHDRSFCSMARSRHHAAGRFNSSDCQCVAAVEGNEDARYRARRKPDCDSPDLRAPRGPRCSAARIDDLPVLAVIVGAINARRRGSPRRLRHHRRVRRPQSRRRAPGRWAKRRSHVTAPTPAPDRRTPRCSNARRHRA